MQISLPLIMSKFESLLTDRVKNVRPSESFVDVRPNRTGRQGTQRAA